MISPFTTGFVTAFTLILAIGAQNAFILRQGLTGRHLLPLVLFCSASDILVISIGVLGFTAIETQWKLFPVIMTWAGAIFLAFYGAQRLWVAWQNDYDLVDGQNRNGLWATLALAAAFTYLNPHFYLETLLLLGANSVAFDAGAPRFWFAVGAMVSNVSFFFALAYGASLLAPIIKCEKAWRILDLLIGVTMIGLAVKLAFGL